MATLGELHDMVRQSLQKGTTLDTVFPSRVRQAARWIERNRTYQYMKRIGQVQIDLASEFPWAVEVPSSTWKSIDLVRIVSESGAYYPLVLEPNYGLQLTFETGKPSSYTLDGTERLLFDCNPDAAYYVEIFWTQYTSWPVADSSTNWLLENAEDLLLYQTMLHMALFLRDDRMAATYLGGRDEALRTLHLEEEERVNSNTSLSMIYTPEGGIEWLPESS